MRDAIERGEMEEVLQLDLKLNTPYLLNLSDAYSFILLREESGIKLVYPLPLGCEEYDLKEGANIIGRNPESSDPGDNIVTLQNTVISRTHARITVSGNNITVENLSQRGSTKL